jgi:predicted GH43/DUF377 family glycosyl hydrolase
MPPQTLALTRKTLNIKGDATRVLARPFFPGNEARIRAITERVLALPESKVGPILDEVIGQFETRHRDLRGLFERHYRMAAEITGTPPEPSVERRQLIGAYFTNEFSLESVALFNPSMVPHPDPSGLSPTQVRFILSLRACGEGHISSIEFRTGVVDAANRLALTLDPVPEFASVGSIIEDKRYLKPRFARKLREMGAHNPLADNVFDRLEEEFTLAELYRAIDEYKPEKDFGNMYRELSNSLIWLARSNYHINYPAHWPLAECVIFPITENESRGIEDARFVRFVEDDASVIYYATYTAFNGISTLPQLLETTDFRQFHMHTLMGKAVQNKGMALFPRRINGWYWTVSRLDGENIYILRSDNVHFWSDSVRVRTPLQPWELVQIGNCGSPIETEAGWLLLTHGVGPMRQYWLGALLLDLNDPTKVIGHLKDPLLVPSESERDGYVPNVLYSCGGMVVANELILPYAVADTSTAIATIKLSTLLDALRANGGN